MALEPIERLKNDLARNYEEFAPIRRKLHSIPVKLETEDLLALRRYFEKEAFLLRALDAEFARQFRIESKKLFNFRRK